MAEAEPTPNPEPAADDVQAPEPEAADWREGIEDEKTRRFADKFVSPAHIAKTAFEFRQKLSNAVTVPGNNASEDEVREFHKKLGAPDDPSGYRFSMLQGFEASEADEDFQSNIADLFHKAGITVNQAEMMNHGWNEMVASEFQRQERAAVDSRADAEGRLRKEWGGDYNDNLAHANRAATEFGGESFMNFIENAKVDGAPLGNHPEFNRVFATIGRRIGESTVIMNLSEDQKTAGEERRRELTVKIHDAYSAGNVAEADRLIKEREKLTIRMYGDAPIADAEGRSNLY